LAAAVIVQPCGPRGSIWLVADSLKGPMLSLLLSDKNDALLAMIAPFGARRGVRGSREAAENADETPC